MDDEEGLSTETGLREKLEWLMLFRLVLVTLLLGSAVAVNVNDVESFGDPNYLVIISLIIGTYAATLVYAHWLRRWGNLSRLVHVQLSGDVILIGGLILVTGGTESIFAFLFFLTIINGALLLGRPGALFAASVCSISLASIVLLQFGNFEFVEPLLIESHRRSERVPVYAMTIHVVAFYSVAILAGHLAQKLGQVGSELEQRRIDIRELRALNQNILASIDSGLVTLDRDGRIIYFNRAAERITGVQAAEVTLRPIAEILPEFEQFIPAGRTRQIVGSNRYEADLVTADGKERFLGFSVSTLRDSGGRDAGWILIFQDLTEVRALESEIKRRDHLSAIGKLSAAIAHEIRNPLASISGSIELMSALVDPPDEARQLMDIVIREVDRLNGLIREFLNYARPLPRLRSELNLNELVEETVRIFRQDAERARDVTIDIVVEEPEPIVLAADGERLKQVLWNLLRNSCEAMDAEGEIEIRLGTIFAGRDPALHAFIIVQDSGPGIGPDDLEQLFEPFFTTKEDGTGLGLAMCHRVVAEHGGLLRAENGPEGGARFSIMVPIRTEDELAAAEEAKATRRRPSAVTASGEAVTLSVASPDELLSQ